MSFSLFTKFPATVEIIVSGPPAGWTIIEGEPITQSYRFFASEDGSKLSGMWRCSEGKFRVTYAKWEFCHVLSGQCVVTQDGGSPVSLGAGDSFILEKGFEGSWEVLEAMEKHFVFAA